jgi:hypothetical protein
LVGGHRGAPHNSVSKEVSEVLSFKICKIQNADPKP